MAGSQDRFCLMVKGTTNCPQNMILNPLRRRYSFIRNLLTPLHRSLHPLATKPPKSIHNSTNTPYSTCFPHLLPLCIKFEHLKPLKATLIVHGLFTNKPLLGEFLKHCFHLGAPDLALSTFDKIHKPSVFLQNFVVRCLCDNELYEDVLGVYARCQILGCGSDNYTFPFVIKACAALGAFQIGREVHCAVLRSGFGDNVVIQTGLVDFYAKNGRLESARLLHDKMLEPDLVSWNALISGYSLHGFHEDVFKLCRTIGVAGLKPNVSTLASVIPMCSRSGYVLIGKSLHGLAFKCGYSMDECLTPALISMYASIGDLSVSRCMFDCLEKKNVAVWNAMISAYAQNRESADAFELFRKMPRDDVQRNVITFVSIIPCSEDLGSTLHGESVHACIIKEGLENQLSVVTALLSMYGKLGDLYSAKFLFDQMPHRNLLTWNSIVSAYVHNGLYDASLAAFRELQFAGFDPDMISIVSILSSCSKLKANFLGKSVHAYCLMWGIDVNLNVSNALLAFYSDCCMLTSAISLFRRMEVRNVISWNTLISGCAHNRDVENAVILLQRLQQEGLELDSVSLISVLPCFNETENLVQGMAIHGYATKAGLAFDVSLANALISMYLNCGELDAGKLVFVDMPIRSVISWNALITGYRCRGLQNEVMALLGQMVKDNQKPNHVTLLNVVPVCDTYLQGRSIVVMACTMSTL
ncbi:hypothetical protein RJ639_005433 [Escallonia herrerae]|uniref:Pentatricopeptide repeat-containing protein n=1 Tax=Escallonia herrerae TaxID=1293975 RepID=A0AA89AVB9_9ASTE|nr:hypothetical protein RJ639_005433 [Escallonia herrerae]